MKRIHNIRLQKSSGSTPDYHLYAIVSKKKEPNGLQKPLKDLNKQKRVIFSYLKSCKDEPIKKMAKLAGKLEEEFGNIDEMNTFSKANKNAKFIKVSYDNGKWSISAEGLSDNLEFNKKQTPEAITCLVQLADRLDEQDAAYALCHAKKAGLFTMAALPFVRTDLNNTLFNTRYEKTPTTTLGPIEKPADAVYTTNLPVSRQIASEDDLDNEKIDETSVFIDEEGTLIPVNRRKNIQAVWKISLPSGKNATRKMKDSQRTVGG